MRTRIYYAWVAGILVAGLALVVVVVARNVSVVVTRAVCP